MNKLSKTDWSRVKREAAADAPIAFDETTEPYNPNDATATKDYWKHAIVRRGPQKEPTKAQVAIRFDRDLLEVLKATGKGWQTRVNEMLRAQVLGGRRRKMVGSAL